MIARLALFAALAGSALGAAVVLADERDEAPAIPVVAAAATPTPAPGQMNGARDVRILRQVPDPAGGRPWAIRRFTGKSGNVAVECHQIGRLDGERFGWVDALGAFTVKPPASSELSGICNPAGQPRRFGAQPARFTTITIPPGGTPQPLVTVTWGVAAPDVCALIPEGEPPIAIGDDHLFLEVRKGEGGPTPVVGVLEHRNGTREPFDRVNLPPTRGERPVGGTQYVAVSTPDPAGSEPWAMLAGRGTRGGLCPSLPGRLVGARLGTVERTLGIFMSTGFEGMLACPRPEREPTRAYPMRINTGFWGAGFADSRGRVERRMESTRTVFSGLVHEDVVSVTIRTPRDVRTLVPSSKAHAILAVYDGRFPGGKVTATARMKDGREVTRSLYVE